MNTALEVFEKSGAILNGHFLLTSGLHSPVYWEKFRVLEQPLYTRELCCLIVDNYREQNVEVVAAPTTGGIILTYEVASQLGVRGIFAEKDGSKRSFRRGFNIEAGERVLLVDDILTTGSSVRQVIDAVSELQGNIIGIGVLVDRSEKDPGFGYPLFSCLKVPTIAYKPEECPQCRQGIPLERLGGH
jgi:orotate phosphoribosyltransferase